jgi:hypothetical protein
MESSSQSSDAVLNVSEDLSTHVLLRRKKQSLVESTNHEDQMQEIEKRVSSKVEQTLKYVDYEKTVMFLSSFYKFSMLICIATALGCLLDIWISYEKIEAANLIFEKTFILAGTGVSLCYLLLMIILRNQWPINTFINNMLFLWIGYVGGFVTCTHLKSIIRIVESNDQD